MFATVAFVGTVLEAAFWPERGNQELGLAETVLFAIAVYWWYHLDKIERQFKAGLLQNLSVAAIAVIGLPVYFVRSRGWRRGIIAVSRSFAFMLLIFLIAVVGYLLGRAVAF